MVPVPPIKGGPGRVDLGDVTARPGPKCADGSAERLPKRRKFILHPRRSDRKDGALYEAIALKSTQA